MTETAAALIIRRITSSGVASVLRLTRVVGGAEALGRLAAWPASGRPARRSVSKTNGGVTRQLENLSPLGLDDEDTPTNGQTYGARQSTIQAAGQEGVIIAVQAHVPQRHFNLPDLQTRTVNRTNRGTGIRTYILAVSRDSKQRHASTRSNGQTHPTIRAQ